MFVTKVLSRSGQYWRQRTLW